MLVHRLAKTVAFTTFMLLVIGGAVNATGSSLACPEPTMTCHGRWFPPLVGGVLYEHGHRLAAMTVGLLQILLTLALMWRRPARQRVLGLLLLAIVITQGMLGAITVAYLLPWYVSSAHLMLGMSYFALLIYTAFLTRPPQIASELSRHERRRKELGRARSWIKLAVAMVFVQLAIGALVRHLGAALACVGMPACTASGQWWPDAWVQQIHMVHRGFGIIVALVTTIAAVKVFRAARSWPGLRMLALVAPLLVIVQVVLGIYTVLTMRSVLVTVGHFAGATALWAVWIAALCLTRPRHKAASERVSPSAVESRPGQEPLDGPAVARALEPSP